MNIHVCGINYKAAAVEIREKLSFTAPEQIPAVIQLKERLEVDECILISTCNRTEVYVYTGEDGFNSSEIEDRICELKGLSPRDYKKYFYFYSGINAVRHLFKVASGLDSMILGEDQILGQVKAAQETALEAHSSQVVLNALFRDAITAAKKVKTGTELSKKPVSVSTLAVKLLSDIFSEGLKDKAALIIGTGKIGAITLKNLISSGIGELYITNRSHGKAAELAGENNVKSLVEYQDRYSYMDKADIIISSTSSPHYTITRDMLEKALTLKKERVFIDLAVPRDIDEDIRHIEDVMYYNIDHLRGKARENADEKLLEAIKAEQIIDEAIIAFERWYSFRNVLPAVMEIQRYTGDFAEDRITAVLSRLKTASDEDKETVKAAISGTINTLMNKFVYSVRETAEAGELEVYFKCMSKAIEEGGGR